MAEISLERDIAREQKKVSLSWHLKPGGVFFMEEQKGDRPDWYHIRVPRDHSVLIERGRVRGRKGNRVGLGVITEIENGPFEHGGIYVMAGSKAKIPFPQSGVEVGPKRK